MKKSVYPSISMQLSHSINHFDDNPALKEERNSCHWCRFREWESNKLFPVSIVNRESEDTIDNNFEFIEKNIIGEGVELADEDFQAGCECASSFDCMKGGCYCLEDIDTLEREEGIRINAYHIVGRRKGCLRGEMLRSRMPIYECNKQCNCPETCPNKVVSRGRQIPLQIFRTRCLLTGSGLRSTEDIMKGQFVGCYLGELITAEEANWRRAQSTKSQKKDVYLFALDKFTDPNSSDERLRGEPYEIDGEYFGGPTRFINHSCDPNLRIFAVVRDLANKPFHDLCFFALKEIPRFTELTFDYDGGVRGEEKAMDKMVEGMTRCLCGANNCRNWLW
ncbi:Histone-lysine N-methyltransferase, H3 lysine-9 specific dim-5 [Golovinomyces cichoracearum]|uniref:Histone-lysine N-methyltransferase, H3 lysine-9 specific dim-5 n=1 Tax=Golovinomyces cichoracearum TaxID=62708 RepID=A0A420HFH2_9PEZI|nr:Histone-lysine N-methyltransferase, H3 lysine-9 specific dim-5 [Golovinomyces cichoracearum]